MKAFAARLVLVAILTLPAYPGEQLAQQPKKSKLWRWSVVSMVLANALDTGSSIGAHETNPLLGTGTFGGRAIAIKSGFVLGSFAVQHWLVNRHPSSARPMAFGNFAIAGGLTAIAISNFRVPREQPSQTSMQAPAP